MKKADKTVDVTINIKGVDKPGKLGYFTRKKPELVDGKWIDTDEDQVIFGKTDDLGYMTHMCYENYSHDTWKEWLDDLKDRRGLDKFYFDAGGNGCPMYCMMDEMYRAMTELGLIKKSNTNRELAAILDEAIRDLGCGNYEEVGLALQEISDALEDKPD